MTTILGINRTAGSTGQNLRAPAQEQSPKASVMVVEDHEDTRLMLRTMLELRGLSVVEAGNGEMAIALAANVHLDLILMDANLPLLDGLDATRRIRELAFGREIPIVIISGHAQPAFKSIAFAAGCSDYIIKPFALRELDRVLERHLSQSRSNQVESAGGGFSS